MPAASGGSVFTRRRVLTALLVACATMAAVLWVLFDGDVAAASAPLRSAAKAVW